MIPFDFDYYRPDSIEEAVNTYAKLSFENKRPFYYSGGTEIITSARTNSINTGAVIDIKGIDECTKLEIAGSEIVIGAAVTLSRISETNYFPMLTKVMGFIADHTVRDKLTLGGNICGRIIYKEGILPLLISDSKVLISGKKGKYFININQIFDKKLKIEMGELLVQIRVNVENIKLPYYAVKMRNQGVTGYPLISLAAVKKDELIRIGFSGLCAFPFRSIKIEKVLNDKSLSINQRIATSLKLLPSPILQDMQGSAAYRSFVYQNILQEGLEILEGGKNDSLQKSRKDRT